MVYKVFSKKNTKNLVSSKQSCTFAPDLDNKCAIQNLSFMDIYLVYIESDGGLEGSVFPAYCVSTEVQAQMDCEKWNSNSCIKTRSSYRKISLF